MKKLLTLLLALAMLFALAVPAYAADKKPSVGFVTFGLGGDFF